MKKLAICLMIVCAFGARAENEPAATSKEYVDTELATKQPIIPAEGNNVVMTFDSSATDGIGTKQVYDESASYTEQQDALVTAQTANAAVQMAINGEFYCKEWSTIVENDCWLWGIKAYNYDQYNLLLNIKHLQIFSSNYSAQVSFDTNTKISTILIQPEKWRANATFKLSASRSSYKSGHKYYFWAKIRTTIDGVTTFISRNTTETAYLYPTTEWGIHGTIFQAIDFSNPEGSYYPVIEIQYSGGNQGIQIDQNEFGVYDLTEIFGEGNEPATADAAAQALGLLYIPSNQQ